MKKRLCIALALLFLGLCACGKPGAPPAEEITTQAEQPPAEEDAPYDWAIEITPPADYEVLNGFAKTPTHYYSADAGGLYRAPADNLAARKPIPLPGSYKGMKLAGAEICGITEEWLFVNCFEDTDEEHYEQREYVTYRLAMETWEAQAIATGMCGTCLAAWYNPVADSLLISNTIDMDATLEAVQLNSRERAPVEAPEGRTIQFWNAGWRNTLDGEAALELCESDDGESGHYFYVFDKDNRVRLSSSADLNLARRDGREAPQNQAEKDLLKQRDIMCYIICGSYVYYVERDRGTQQNDLWRMNPDGTGAKLLRKQTNIFDLQSAGGKLFCRAVNPTVINEWGDCERGIYLLDVDGRHVKTLFRYEYDSEGNSGYGLARYGDKLMVMYYVIYGPLSVELLYDPATGTKFCGG